MTTVHGKKIIRNTFYLYIRMFITTLISIYTSRIILYNLGVVDYGIYNIVGGIIVFFTFISSSMSSSTQRYLNIAMGKGEKEAGKIFSNSIILYILMTVGIGILCEILGLWFLRTKLNIPINRMEAAEFVFHCTILAFCLNLFRSLYNALVIAYEEMSFYAYTSLVEAGLKLIIVWMLPLFAFDKLKTYALLVLGVSLLLLVWYYFYCRKHFSVSKFSGNVDKKVMRNMAVFSSWSLFGGIADVGVSQGTNIILNIFHGVTLNAALGLANQIRSALFSFVANLQIAANPQIVKSYSMGDIKYFSKLVYSTSKFSYILLLLVTLPLFCNIEFILDLWLVKTPYYTANFLRLIIVLILFDSLHGPLWTAMQAYGKLKQYQIITNCLWFLSLPLTYIVLKLDYPPGSIIIVQIILKNIVFIARIYYACIKCRISSLQYVYQVIQPIFIISIISVPFTIIFSDFQESGWIRLFTTLLVSTFLIILLSYSYGITTQEKLFIKNEIKRATNDGKHV